MWCALNGNKAVSGTMSNNNNNPETWRALNNGSMGELIRNLSILIHDEPVVQMAIRILTSHCLGGGGIQLRYGGSTPPSPNFQRYLDKYFYPFCREAIVLYLAVGFVPYRIRLNERGSKIPEVLPLGTFTWHVGRGNQDSAATPWSSLGRPPPSDDAEEEGHENEKRCSDKPILKYIVNSAYCREEIRVFVFVNPQIMFSCTSPLSSLIQPYLTLSHKRDCTLRADAFNSMPSMVFEQQDKVLLNDVNNSGLALQNAKDMGGKLTFDHRNIGERQLMLQQLIHESKDISQLPRESISVVAPKNHTVHSLDKALTPQDIQKEELQFCRLVAMACGIPVSMLIQGGGVVGGGSSGSSSGAKDSWAENTEGSNRVLLDTCRCINRQLEQLLMDVHESIYGSEGHPSFKIPVVPVIPFEQLMLAYESQLLDDKYFSMIFETLWGFPLSEDAKKARAEKRKAEFVLPFLDRKDDKKTTSKKK